MTIYQLFRVGSLLAFRLLGVVTYCIADSPLRTACRVFGSLIIGLAASIQAFAADTTPPSTPVVTDGGSYTTSLTELSVNWMSLDAESPLVFCTVDFRQGSATGPLIANRTLNCATFVSALFGDLPLQQGMTYYIGVRARNSEGLWSLTGFSDGIKVDASAPSAPGRPAEGSTSDLDYDSDGAYTTHWTAASDAQSGIVAYELQERVGTTGTWSTLATTTVLNAAVTGRLHNTRYFYQVRAKNNAGTWGTWSSISDGMLVDTSAPTAVTVADDGLTTTSTTQLHATWTTSTDSESGVSLYQYLIRQDSTGGTIIVDYTSVGLATQVTRAGLTLNTGKTYFIGVRARNGALTNSATHYSNGIQVSPSSSDTTPPSAPGQPTEGSPDQDIDTDGSYTVSWSPASDPESGIASYELQEQIGGAGAWNTLSSAVSGTSLSVSGRMNASTYYYRVRARNGSGQTGAFSVVSDGILIDSEAPQVSGIDITNLLATSASLNWTTNEAASCEVRCGTSSPPSALCTVTPGGTTHATHLTALTPATTEHVNAVCTDAAGNQSATSATSFTTLPLTAVPSQPSVTSINGRQLLLQRRNPDGTLAPAVPYLMTGVTWSPASRTTMTSASDPNNVTVRRPEFGQWYLTDIPMLKAMNVNTVRMFMDPGVPGDANITVPGLAVLDELYLNGIMVVMTVDNGNNTVERIQPVVDYYKNHPAVLMWSLGSEWNLNLFWKPSQFPTVDSAAHAIESAAQLVKSLDTGHPVVSSYGNIDTKPNDIQRYVTQVCPSVDVWSFNPYKGPGLSRFFEQWGFISSKPMFLGEFGIDAFNSTTQQEDPGTQAQWDGQLWDEIARNLSANDPNNTALGGTFFEFNDEWWKAGSWNVQDPFGWSPLAFPDGTASEDWWGIVTIDRVPRQIYHLLTMKFGAGYQPPPAARTITYRAESVSGLFARFWESGAIMFEGQGAIPNGARGFNIAAIDLATGRLRDPIQSFDTWASRSNGTHTNAMVAYLDNVPNRTLLLIAVADEAGLNDWSSCTPLTYPWTNDVRARLQQLGSTQISNYCYGDQWALIAVKGEGAARSESLGHGTSDAPTQATVQLQ